MANCGGSRRRARCKPLPNATLPATVSGQKEVVMYTSARSIRFEHLATESTGLEPPGLPDTPITGRARNSQSANSTSRGPRWFAAFTADSALLDLCAGGLTAAFAAFASSLAATRAASRLRTLARSSSRTRSVTAPSVPTPANGSIGCRAASKSLSRCSPRRAPLGGRSRSDTWPGLADTIIARLLHRSCCFASAGPADSALACTIPAHSLHKLRPATSTASRRLADWWPRLCGFESAVAADHRSALRTVATATDATPAVRPSQAQRTTRGLHAISSSSGSIEAA